MSWRRLQLRDRLTPAAAARRQRRIARRRERAGLETDAGQAVRVREMRVLFGLDPAPRFRTFADRVAAAFLGARP